MEVKELIQKGTKVPLFDVDWTLLKATPENKKPHDDAFDFALHSTYNLPDATKQGFFAEGMIDSQILIEIAKQNGVSEENAKNNVNDALSAMVDYFVKHADQGYYEVMPGVVDLLNKLKSTGLSLGLLTGNVEEIGWEKVKRAGIGDYFTFGAFGSMALKRVDLIAIAKKRAEEIYNVDIPLKNLIIIGDSPLDIACARDGGIEVIAVGSGHFKSHQLSEADLVVGSLKDHDKIIKFLNLPS